MKRVLLLVFCIGVFAGCKYKGTNGNGTNAPGEKWIVVAVSDTANGCVKEGPLPKELYADKLDRIHWVVMNNCSNSTIEWATIQNFREKATGVKDNIFGNVPNDHRFTFGPLGPREHDALKVSKPVTGPKGTHLYDIEIKLKESDKPLPVDPIIVITN